MTKSREERLAIFWDRLAAAPAVGSHDEAYDVLCKVLNEVEDEFSGIISNPGSLGTDGRLYPPLGDNRQKLNDDLVSYRSKGHRLYIQSNGAISIFRLVRGEINPVAAFEKSGIDNQKVDLTRGTSNQRIDGNLK